MIRRLFKRAVARQAWRVACSGMFASLALVGSTNASTGISGTMSNFDVFNDSTTDAYGAELELEGLHPQEVMDTYPSHFSNKVVEEYSNGNTFGTRIRYSTYNFNAAGFLAPSVPQSTNGHFCVNIPGCEHFGFSVSNQPTATRFYWLDNGAQRIGNTPMAIPNPTWTYQPAANGQPAVMQAEVAVPEPAEKIKQNPDSIWMKVYKTELERPVRLGELMSNGGVSPEDESETETEWELLEGGKMKAAEAEVPERGKSVIRRYEFYEYSGPYDEEHEPISIFLDEEMNEPPAGELGAFIAANMVAANLGELPNLGDFDGNGVLDIADLDALGQSVRAGDNDLLYDVNGDMAVDAIDYQLWVTDLRRSWMGDANLDGEFNSEDLVTVFQAGQYEDGLAANSSWVTGDWNADAEFDTADLILAFQDGGYGSGDRAAVAAVPEPSVWGTLAVLAATAASCRLRRSR